MVRANPPIMDPPLTVSQLSDQIERALKAGVADRLAVRGELSNFRAYGQSGHLYFTLKDPHACINCAMFRSAASKLKFRPQDGMEVLIRGQVGLYAQRGQYQLIVSTMQPLGQGALELAFQQLRQKLEKEGLFAPDHKRPLPAYPLRIALVTSAQTAALQDILKVLRRYPWLRLMLYHVPVQGDGAAKKIASALRHLNDCASQVGGVDVIILSRGGGSLEDLWEFNEEIVARAVYDSEIPIITGIGHEVDVSIADLVADYHAHTPTEAAQVVAGRWQRARSDLSMTGTRLRTGMRSLVAQQRNWVDGIARHEMFRRPMDYVDRLRQQVDDRQRDLERAMANRLKNTGWRLRELGLKLEQNRPSAIVSRMRQSIITRELRLHQAVRSQLQRHSSAIQRLTARIQQRHPRHAVHLSATQLKAMETRLSSAMANAQERRNTAVQRLERLLNSVGPAQVLKRGYTITLLKTGKTVVRSAGQIKAKDRLITHFADGQVESTAEDPNQLGLFE